MSEPGSAPGAAERSTPRVAYSTNRPDLTAPGDRRRFCHYARRRGLEFELADPARDYDVVVASYGADLGVWSRLPRRTRLVFDLVDSHLAVRQADPRAAARGLVKFAFRRTRGLHLDWRRMIEDTCRRADAVICTTEEQRRQILPYCSNVHVILDFQPEASARFKTDYARGETFNLVWEGLAWNLATFAPAIEPLRELERSHRIALHLVTDLSSPLLFGDTLRIPTRWLIRRHVPLRNVVLHRWSAEGLAAFTTAADLAVIPIPLDRPFMAGKPENKLVLFWRMGMPVVTSATPAYERAMRAAGLELTCRTAADWRRLLERALGDEAMRREAGERGRAHAESAYSEARLLSLWDGVFASIGAAPAATEPAPAP